MSSPILYSRTKAYIETRGRQVYIKGKSRGGKGAGGGGCTYSHLRGGWPRLRRGGPGTPSWGLGGKRNSGGEGRDGGGDEKIIVGLSSGSKGLCPRWVTASVREERG